MTAAISAVGVLASAALLLIVACCAFPITTLSSLSVAQSDDSGLLRLRPESANDILRILLNDHQIIEDDATAETMKHPRSSQVMLEGVVSKRRVVGKHLVFIDIIPMELPTLPTQKRGIKREKSNTIYEAIESIAPVHAIMMRDFWNKNLDDDNRFTSSCSYDIYHKIIQPGVHVQLTGHVGSKRNEAAAAGAVVFCHTAKYTLLNDNPQHLQTVLNYAKEGALDMNEVFKAIPLLSRDELLTTTATYSPSELASEVLGRFPKNYLFNPSKLMGSTNQQKLNLLPMAPNEYIAIPNQFGEDHMSATVNGVVRNRRRYQGNITVLTLVEPIYNYAKRESSGFSASRSSNEFEGQQLSVVLHPNTFGAGNNSNRTSIELCQTYGNVLSTGAYVSVQGYIMTAGSSEVTPILWASSCRMLRSSWRPNTVRQILDTLHMGKIAVDEAADALKLPGGYYQAEDIAKGTTSVTERQWLAAEQSQLLQDQNSILGTLTTSMKDSLTSFAYARDKYPIENVNCVSEFDLSTGDDSVVQSNDSMLRTSSVGSRWQRSKQPQLNFMINQIGTVLRSHPEYGQRKLKVVDIGGGRGHLSNSLAELFGDIVEVQVVDISRSAIDNGMMTAKRLGLQNIRYTAIDATTLDVEGVDVVVALHACGALADAALGHAATQGAGFVVCPCCYLSNPHLRVSVPTDRIDHAKSVTVEEWLMVDPIQYEQLKRTAEVQGNIKLASEAMHTVCGLRSIAVDRQWHGSRRWPASKLGLIIEVMKFPIAFSTRNFCLVGSFNQTSS
jgi:SAM-dependent methyltransferase